MGPSPRVGPSRRVGPRRGRTLAAVAALAGLVAGSAVACGGPGAPSGVEPLAEPGARGDLPPPATGDASSAAGAAAAGAPAAAPTPGAEGDVPPGVGRSDPLAAARAELADLLARYDRALSALAADPLVAGDDGHRLTRAWLSVVVAGSTVDEEVRWRILTDGRDNGVRIVPDGSGTSYRTTALDVTVHGDGSLSWDSCGYVPGVAVDLRTGQVRDATRSTTRGRGTAVRGPDGRLAVSSLDDEQVEPLPEGRPDPCPALAMARP